MHPSIRTIVAAMAFTILMVAIPSAGNAQASRPDMDTVVKDYLLQKAQRAEIEAIVQDYLTKHPEDVQRIVKDYLVKNPDVLQEALTELIKRRTPATAQGPSAADKSAAIKSNAALLFTSARQVTIGNPQGDVTLVEFFDYNCGYCKRALADTLALLKDDPNLKIVLKEFPILGPGSVEAARVAVAVRMQDSNGGKYFAFHQKMMGDRGQANKDSAMAAASGAGLDMARLERDMASAEADQTISESTTLARALGINGTPGYVVGDEIVPGAVGVNSLKTQISVLRKRRAG